MAGLTSLRARALLAQGGPNEIAEKKQSALMQLLRSFAAPASLMLLLASALSFSIDRTFDGYFILALLALNVGISLWHERKADNALDELKKKLSVESRVMRDGRWAMIPSREIVVGDFVECGVGALVPADLTLVEANNLQINEAVLTGESLPREKKVGETAYSGSVVMTGMLRGEVVATGNRAFFGRIAASGKGEKRRSSMENDILSISRFLIVSSAVAIAILTVFFYLAGEPIADTLLLDLSLLIAGIPISLPTIMTLIVSIGAVELAKESALTRRLAALEDFANVTLLLTDKTGTLSQNKITVERIHAYAPYTEKELLPLLYFAAQPSEANLIDRAIMERGKFDASTRVGEVRDFTPADSVRKRTTTLLSLDSKSYLVSLGTPPILSQFSSVANPEQMKADIERAAEEGSRAVAIAIKKDPAALSDEREMELAGIIVLSDPLRADASETLAYLRKEGVKTIMVSGDTKETASHVSQKLGMHGSAVTPKEKSIVSLTSGELESISVFAEVMPENKLELVQRAKKDFTVAMAGDGVNDLPAVRAADVGLAVESAVDALKGTADLVLLAPGIAAMKTALIEARKIYFRLYNYSIYRISESFRLIVTALVLGILIKGFPLTPVQIILLAFLNDIPIITLAFDRVKRTDRPAELSPRERFLSGVLFGMVGVANSLLLYALMAYVFHSPLPDIQTAFFLKLTVSGHMLIYVAHTKERWWRFLPAPIVILATSATQIVATGLAVGGIFVSPIPLSLAAFVWVWAFFWMQVSEAGKYVQQRVKI